MEQGHSFFSNPFLGSHLEVVFSFSLRHLTLGLPANPEGAAANDFILPLIHTPEAFRMNSCLLYFGLVLVFPDSVSLCSFGAYSGTRTH